MTEIYMSLNSLKIRRNARWLLRLTALSGVFGRAVLALRKRAASLPRPYRAIPAQTLRCSARHQGTKPVAGAAMINRSGCRVRAALRAFGAIGQV